MSKVATKEDLQEMYSRILPYLNRQSDLANADTLAKIGVNQNGAPTFNGELLSVPNNGQFDKLYNFSTTEQVVGKWTNGKPIYQKIFTHGALTNATTEINEYVNIGVSVDEVINLEALGKWHTGAGSDGYFRCECWQPSSSQYINIYVGPNSGNATERNKVHYQWFGDLTWLASMLVVVRYTKTTDTANSFKYAGENDYSTNETIVGTWIDGRPVYQKTISIGNYPNATVTTVAHGITSLDNILSLEAYATNGTVNVWLNSSYTNNIPSEPQNLVIYRNGDNIRLSSNFDASSYSGHVTLKYTKTTD